MGEIAGTTDRTVFVAPERLAAWIERFSLRHGETTTTLCAEGLRLAAADGAVAVATPDWEPLEGHDDLVAELVASVRRPRLLGALLVRKAAHAVGIFDGPRLVNGRTGSHYVQGRTKAGGWSQQRYARRREHQATRALRSAADDAADVLLPRIRDLEGLVCAGDGAAVQAVLQDPRLAPLAPLPRLGRGVISVPDPKRSVLEDFPNHFRAVPVRLNAAAQGRADGSAFGEDDPSGDE